MTNTSKTAKSSGIRIVFFGSGPVAAESLKLLKQDFDIEAVVTKPATMKEMASAAEGAKLFSVESRHELDGLISEHPFKSSVAILIDFGIIVSQKVIDYFPRGIINSHFSLLPEWRGADPISYALLSGQSKTGVSLMLLTAGMDEGPIIAFGEQEISDDMNSATLTDKLVNLSYALLRDMLPEYLENQKTVEQFQAAGLSHARGISYSRRLTKDDGSIDWHKPAAVLEREIRAFSTWPKSRASLNGIEVIITEAHVGNANGKPGQIKIVAGSGSLIVYCGQGYLRIEKLKPAGKNEMSAKAFLAGYRSKLGV